VKAQVKIGDNPTNINSASLLELETTNKGLVFPRVSLTNVASSAPLPAGLLTGTVVYNTNAAIINGNGIGLYVWTGSAWISLISNINSTAWSLTGNTGTSYASNFIGTTDNVGFRVRTNNIQRIVVDSLGSVGIGSTAFNTVNRERLLVDYGTTTSHTIANFKGSINDYLQINLQNTNAGSKASSDFVATADDGTDSTYYVDLGINGSAYSPAPENWGNAHDAYLYSNSRHLLIGTEAIGSDVFFLLGGGRITANTVLKLNGPTGNIVVGKGDATDAPQGNVIRGPNASGTNIAGGGLTLKGGGGTGTAAGGNLNLYGGSSVSGATGAVNMIVNPLNISGIEATSSFPTDSILIIYNGVVKKAPYSSLPGIGAATLNSFSATAPLTYNNTTGVFGITQATTSSNGYLSSTDWNTFNNKVAGITLNTPDLIYNNPVVFSVAAGAATGTLSLKTQTANKVFAGPASGVAATPSFRTLVAADIPSLAGNYIQNQTTLQASSNFNISGNGIIGTNLSVTGTSTLTGAVTSGTSITNTGFLTSTGGIVNINAGSNFATNINTGTSTSNVTVGNSANNIFFPKFNTIGGLFYTSAATGQIGNTATDMTWDDVNDRLGIGITAPAYKLSVLGTNPLYLSGVLATSTFTADSVLTINAGVVKKAPYSSLPGGNAWALTGNAGTNAANNFIGTIDGIDFVVKTNGIERMRILGAVNGTSQAGWVGLGIAVPRSRLDVTASFANKNVITIQNTNNTGFSSVDMLDNTGALKSTFGYANPGTGGVFAGRNYFNNYGSDFILTANSSNFDFFMQGSSGNVGINTSTPSAKLDVEGNFQLGVSGSVLTNVIKTSVTVNPGSVSTTATTTATATVTGAALNGTVIVNPRSTLSSGLAIAYCFVSAANTITIGFISNTAVDPPLMTFDVTIIQ